MGQLKRESKFWGTGGLVLGTLLIVIVSIISTYLTQQSLGDQVNELRRATELQWRPWLYVEQMNMSLTPDYIMGRSDTSLSGMVPIEEIEISSREYLAVQRLFIDLKRTLQLQNKGLTPLRVTKWIPSTLYLEEWEEIYNKSVEKLVVTLRTLPDIDTMLVDIVVFPGGFEEFSEKRVKRSMPIDVFHTHRDGDKKLTLYPYIYVEYEDINRKRYNLIVMHHAVFDIVIEDNKVSIVGPVAAGLEKYRWDVLRFR